MKISLAKVERTKEDDEGGRREGRKAGERKRTRRIAEAALRELCKIKTKMEKLVSSLNIRLKDFRKEGGEGEASAPRSRSSRWRSRRLSVLLLLLLRRGSTVRLLLLSTSGSSSSSTLSGLSGSHL